MSDNPAPTPVPQDIPVDNPPYEVPPGPADAPPAVPPDVNLTQEAQDYLDGFAKSPDPRDPATSDLTPGDLSPPSAPVAPEAEDPF